MTRYRIAIAAASAAFLLGTSAIATQAAEVKAGVGGVNASVSVGGNSVASGKASVGNTASATATVGGGGGNGGSGGGNGGGSGNVASTSATVGNTNVNANIGMGNGPLVDSTTGGNAGGGLSSGTNVNLGGLFGGGNGTGTGDGGTGGGIGNAGGGNGGNGNGNGGGRTLVPDSVQAAIGGMSDGEVATMKRRCNSILAMPNGYDSGIIDLCKVLRRL